ncbi:glycosidase [Pseudarthrobacter sp. P1]|uniref:pullulanase X25 domain-containing protein n=1 Tax=Pseudarthrobacter sp. P1 TaxID=3418418 RepID=UPI003CF7B2C9
MAAKTVDAAKPRLKAVLDVLAESVWAGEPLNAGQVLAGAVERHPFSDREAELLSGGIPRGHKNLTAATAKLAKAGWLVKGRSGWTITDDGLRATVAFADADAFAEALENGTPVPADLPVPTEAPAAKAGTRRKAPAKSAAKATADAAQAPAPADTDGQPDAVAIAGDFNTLLGAPEDWAPQHDAAQMAFDAGNRVWTLAAELPAGFYTYKVAINRGWEENYGAFGIREGANHELAHDGGPVTFTYNHTTRDITVG